MKLIISLISLIFLLPCMASADPIEFFDRRGHFSYHKGRLALRPNVANNLYVISPVASAKPKSQWPQLNQYQRVQEGSGQLPYRLEIHSSTTTPGDYIFTEGGVSENQKGNGESELIVTEAKGGRLIARTRCHSKYTQISDDDNDIVLSLGNISGSFSLGPAGKKDQRQLMDCTTVTPQFCQAIMKGTTEKQMKSCISTMRNITKQNPNDWKQLKDKERSLTANWMMPLSENFYGNVNNKKSNKDRTSLDTTQLRKYTGFTDKDVNSFVNLVRDCEIFKLNPTNQAVINPTAGNQPKRPEDTSL